LSGVVTGARNVVVWANHLDSDFILLFELDLVISISIGIHT
jgi:hypothetical protein